MSCLRSTSNSILRESTFAHARLGKNLAIARKLIDAERSKVATLAEKDESTLLALDLLWARLTHHVLMLAGAEFASAELAGQALEASRSALCRIQNSRTSIGANQLQKDDDDDDGARGLFCRGLNFTIRDAVAVLHPSVRVCIRGGGVRVMVAVTDIPPGSTVCSELPFASWKGGSVEVGLKAFRGEQQQQQQQEEEKTTSTTALKMHDTKNTAEKPDVIWCPDVTLSEAVTTFLSKVTITRQECRDLFAIRANCHHYIANGENGSSKNNSSQENPKPFDLVTAAEKAKEGVACFDVMSKIQHSCAPNCYYDGSGRLFSSSAAANRIKSGDALAFSYIHRSTLLRGTRERQEAILKSHGFTCGCPRCTDPTPLLHGRSFFCAGCGNATVAEAVRLFPRGSASAFSSSATPMSLMTVAKSLDTFADKGGSQTREPHQDGWVCAECGDTPSAAEVQKFLGVERRLQSTCATLLPALVQQQQQQQQPAPPKDAHEALERSLIECLNVVGKGHWVYLELLRCLGHFFLRVAAMPSATMPTVEMGLETALRWAMKFLAAAVGQGIVAAEASAIASFIFEPALVLLTRLGNSTWRIHAALLLQAAMDADASTALRARVKSKVILELAEKAMSIYRASPDVLLGGGAASTATSAGASFGGGGNRAASAFSSSGLAKTPLEAVCRAAEMDADDATLLASWGQHLADRVSKALQSKSGQQGPLADHWRNKLNLPMPPQ